jgi:N-methylhydantoinase B
MRSTKWLDRADGSREVLPSKCDNVRVAAGDVLHYVTWGGGGWGDPFDRDPALVALEVRRGLVSVEGALRYGVVLAYDEAGRVATVDEAGTDELRARLRAERGEKKVFVFGPGIDELRERCLAETGLPAPKPPVFRRTAAGREAQPA